MNKEEVIQNAKNAVKKVYPNAKFIDKGNFTPTPAYYNIFDDSVVEKVFNLASFGICVRKNETAINDRLSEAASQFNDALLDEQKNKIFDLEERLKKSESDYMDKVHLVCARGREINKLNKVIHEKNMMIKNLILERGRVARLLAAEQTIHKIDLQATVSAENALIYKEKEYEKSLQEKDEVIDDLSRELARSKEREEELIATVNDYLKEIDELKKSRRGDIKTMKELLKKIEDVANKTVNSENTAAARYAKKAMSERMVIPNSRIVVFSSRSPRNNFLDELIKSFIED